MASGHRNTLSVSDCARLPSVGAYVRGWYIAGKYGRTTVKATISAPKTAALKTRAVTKVLVDALAALLMSEESSDLEQIVSCAWARSAEMTGVHSRRMRPLGTRVRGGRKEGKGMWREDLYGPAVWWTSLGCAAGWQAQVVLWLLARP